MARMHWSIWRSQSGGCIFRTAQMTDLISHVLEGPLAVILRLLFSHSCSDFHSSHVKYFVASWRSARQLASAWFTRFASGKVQFTRCSAFTGRRSKAFAGRTFPKASLDTRTRPTIWIEPILTRDESWSFLNIFIIRAGPQIQMTCRKFRSRKFNSKRASFRLFGVAQGSKVCCMFRKAWNIIQPSLSNRLFRIWWNTSVRRVGGKCFEAFWSIWTMHDRTTTKKWGSSYCNKSPSNSCPSLQSRSISEWLLPHWNAQGTNVGNIISSPDELISAISELIASLPKDQLVSLYKNWMKRLNWVLQHRGRTTASE
jgi:hypothetical protein